MYCLFYGYAVYNDMWTSCSLYVQYLQRNICNRKDFVVDHIEGSIKSERSKILNLILSYS